MTKVYCAGPLFNEGERVEMLEIASTLEHGGFSTFLPQRDGLEFGKLHANLQDQGVLAAEAGHFIEKSIFCLDVFQLIDACDVVVANLNGRVPDEGMVVEIAMAWSFKKGLVLFKADSTTIPS